MTRKRWIQDPLTLELIPVESYVQPAASNAPFIMGDIKPYQSMVTGEMIDGRRQHREHLKTHNVIEVGNELDKAKPKPVETAPGLKERVARAVYRHLG